VAAVEEEAYGGGEDSVSSSGSSCLKTKRLLLIGDAPEDVPDSEPELAGSGETAREACSAFSRDLPPIGRIARRR
jgi:hypothetical protein